MRQQYKFYVRGSHESAIYQIRELSDFYEKLDNSILMNVYADTRENTRVNQLELEDLLNDLEKGEVILVTKLDRLSRNVNELRKILKRIEEVGAELIVVKQQDSMVNLFVEEISEKMYERTLESTEKENNVRRKIDNPSLEKLFDILQEALVNSYEENKKLEENQALAYQRYGTKEQAEENFIKETEEKRNEFLKLFFEGIISKKSLDSILQEIDKNLK